VKPPRWTIARKALVTASSLSFLAGLAQWLLLGRPVGGLHAIVALGIPLSGCVFASYMFAKVVVGVRSRIISQAYQRIAAGDFKTDLPYSFFGEMQIVRDMFRTMARSLDELTSSLQDADDQRRRLFADLAHELATPTSTVLGIAEALAHPERFASHDPPRLLAHLEREAMRLTRLIADVRDLAHLDDPETRLEPQRVDVAQLAQLAVERANVIADSGVSIACRAEPAPAVVDATRIDQALANLISNALRYTPPGGRIAIDVERVAESVRLTIEDSGSGVPDDVLPRLGQRLLRLDPSRNRTTGGSGLGLSIVIAIVHRHAGTLQFARAALGGLRVVMTLPAAPT
jgi:two-component system, OmpR family, sensor histidine kinase BaeS